MEPAHTADEIGAAMIRQEALAARADDLASRYHDLAMAAVSVGLPHEAERARLCAEALEAEARAVRSW